MPGTVTLGDQSESPENIYLELANVFYHVLFHFL